MSRDYLSCADTAQLVRAALEQAFPRQKFSVRSHTYAGGASIDISWTDGPQTGRVTWAMGEENLGARGNPHALRHRHVEIMQRHWSVGQLLDDPWLGDADAWNAH